MQIEFLNNNENSNLIKILYALQRAIKIQNISS